jgi:hypothetical protein
MFFPCKYTIWLGEGCDTALRLYSGKTFAPLRILRTSKDEYTVTFQYHMELCFDRPGSKRIVAFSLVVGRRTQHVRTISFLKLTHRGTGTILDDDWVQIRLPDRKRQSLQMRSSVVSPPRCVRKAAGGERSNWMWREQLKIQVPNLPCLWSTIVCTYISLRNQGFDICFRPVKNFHSLCRSTFACWGCLTRVGGKWIQGNREKAPVAHWLRKFALHKREIVEIRCLSHGWEMTTAFCLLLVPFWMLRRSRVPMFHCIVPCSTDFRIGGKAWGRMESKCLKSADP